MLTMLLTVLIVLSASYSNAAPPGWITTPPTTSTSSLEQGTVARILNNATFNSTDNFYAIKKAFQLQPGTHKICILIAFNITCTDHDQPKCDTENNCTSGFYKSVLWTEFDTADIAGKLMLYFASSDLNVFGFDWAGACEVSLRDPESIDRVPSINLVVPSLLCNDTSLESEIDQSLLYITTLMPNRATLSDTPSVYNDLITGYAVDANDFYNYFYHRQSFVVYSVIFGLVSLSIVLGLSTPLFVTIVDSIETTEGKGKPKLYYHFWSSVLLIIIGIWGYGILYNILNDIVYTVILISMLVNSIAGLLIALITAAREEKKAQLFSAPLSEYGCGNSRCTAIWSWIMTIIGFIFMLSFLVYVIYAIPTIAFVYYLYPTRTLIRVPFILGAVFYTITLMSLVLYLFEKVSIEALDLLSPRGIRNACRCCKLCCDLYCYSCKHCDVPSDEENDDDDGDDDESKDERVPLGESRSAINDYGLQPLHVVPPMTSWCALCKRFMCRRCIRQCASSVQHTAEQQRHNRNYYLIKVYEDLKVISGQCHFLISVLQLLAGMIILVVYICAELVLARLVFRQTNVTDINSLLALLPTVIFSVFTWFGRGLIFDVREDLKDLSIPYFKRKETIEEKMLQELIALRRSQCRHKRKVKRKVKRPSRRIERSASLHGLGETP